MKIVLILLCVMQAFPLLGQSTSLSEQLIHCTVRIECQYKSKNKDGKEVTTKGTGSAFFFTFVIVDNRDTLRIPVIVTNNHVVTKSTQGAFYLTLKDSIGNPLYGKKVPVILDKFESLWISHPDPNIDLCIMPMASLLDQAEKKRLRVYYKAFDEKMIPSNDLWSSFLAIEEVLMIGYPNGLWDNVNNLPIVRMGQTATPLKIDYQGKPEFLVNIPAFPGSSGSPIILYNQGAYATSKGTNIGTRLYLLGILYAGPTYGAMGKGITIDKVPVSVQTFTEIPINIGVAISSKNLLGFKEILKQRVREEKK